MIPKSFPTIDSQKAYHAKLTTPIVQLAYTDTVYSVKSKGLRMDWYAWGTVLDSPDFTTGTVLTGNCPIIKWWSEKSTPVWIPAGYGDKKQFGVKYSGFFQAKFDSLNTSWIPYFIAFGEGFCRIKFNGSCVLWGNETNYPLATLATDAILKADMINNGTKWYGLPWSFKSQENTHCIIDNLGRYFFVWGDYRGGLWEQAINDDFDIITPEIYGQRYTASGTPYCNNFKVSYDVKGFAKGYRLFDNNIGVNPIATNENGRVVVCWTHINHEDPMNYTQKIYARLYNSYTGSTIGNSFKVSTSMAQATSEFGCDCAMASNNQFVIAWSHGFDLYVSPTYNVLIRKFDSNGIPLTLPVFVDSMGTMQDRGSDVHMDMDDNGNIIVVSCIKLGTDQRAWYRCYDFDLNPICDPKFTTSTIWRQRSPNVSCSASGTAFLTWNDYRLGYTATVNVWGQFIDISNGSKIGSNFQINDNTISHNGGGSDSGYDKNGNSIVSWIGRQDVGGGNDIYNVFYQRFDVGGSPIGVNVALPTSISRTGNSIAVATSGKFVISHGRMAGYYWTSTTALDEIYYSSFTPSGTIIQQDIQIDDNGEGSRAELVEGMWYPFEVYYWTKGNDSLNGFVLLWHQPYNVSESATITVLLPHPIPVSAGVTSYYEENERNFGKPECYHDPIPTATLQDIISTSLSLNERGS